MATPLMTPAQKTLKVIRMYFDPLYCSPTDDDELLLAKLLETDTDVDTTPEDDTSREDTEGCI